MTTDAEADREADLIDKEYERSRDAETTTNIPMSDMQLMQICIEDARDISFPMLPDQDISALQFAVMQTAFELFRHRAHWLSENPIEEYHDRTTRVAGKIRADSKARYDAAKANHKNPS